MSYWKWSSKYFAILVMLSLSALAMENEPDKELQYLKYFEKKITKSKEGNKSINVEGKKIDDEKARALAKLIETEKLISIRIDKTTFSTPNGFKYIAEAIKKNPTITKVFLSKNNIGDEGAKYIAEALKKNSIIIEMTLRKNNIGDEGAKYIAEALKKNSTLKILSLYDNKIWDEGVKDIAKALKENSTLNELELDKNHISNKTAADITEAIKDNYTLFHFGLDEGIFDYEHINPINRILNRNKKRHKRLQRLKPIMDLALYLKPYDVPKDLVRLIITLIYPTTASSLAI